MKNLLIIGLMAISIVGAQAEDKKPVGGKKIAHVISIEKTGKAIRAGKFYVGKTFAMPEGNRFHNIHEVALGLPCNGCHNIAGYPDNYLFLRRAEFPLKVDGEDVGAVHRTRCLACHSEGGAGRPFYNVTKK